MQSQKPQSFKIHKTRFGLSTVFVAITLIIFFLIGWSVTSIKSASIEEKRQRRLDSAVDFCKALFDENDAIMSGISKEELEDCDIRLTEIENAEGETEKLRKNVQDAKDYLGWLESSTKFFDENNLVKEDVEEKDIISLLEAKTKIAERYQKTVTEKYDQIRNDYDKMRDAENSVNSLFTSVDRADVREDVNRNEYDDAKQKVEGLSQEGLKQKLNEALDRVLPIIEEQEKIARERAEQIRKAREEEQRKIRESEHQLDISPWYINQFSNGLINGCEAASLLMAAKYKGYARGIDYNTFAAAMPKTDNPDTGFYGAMDNNEGNETHWIAPKPLAEFGRSRGINVREFGVSLDALDNEVLNGNPVIIYLTYAFRDPRDYNNGVPRNLHVLVLSGFNSYTGTQTFYDPLGSNAPVSLSKARTEFLYAASGYRALVVR